MTLILIQVTCLVFSLILVITFFVRKNYNSLENKLFKWLMISNNIGLVLELICYYAFSISSKNIILSIVVPRILLFYFLIWIIIFTIYVFDICYNKEKQRFDKDMNRIYIIMSALFILSSVAILVLPLYNHNDGVYFYTYGPAVDYLNVIYAVMFILWIYKLIKNIKFLKQKKYLPIFIFIFVGTVVAIIQKSRPELLLITPMETIIVYLMYFTIENPDIKLIKDLSYTRRMLEKQNEMVSGTVNNLAISLKNPLMEITNFSSKKINKKDEVSSLEEIKKFQKLSLNLVDQINKIMDLTRIENRQLKIKNRLYQTDNLINSIKDIINFRNVDVNYNIDNNIPKVLYGDDDNIKQTFTYLVEFISNYFDRYDLTINISKISVRNNCKLMFSIIVNYKNTKLDFIERDNKCIIETNAWEYELYNRLVELQKGTYEVKKDNSSLIFNFALFQKIKDNNEAVEEEVIKYNNYSGKKILIALDNHLDINKFTELLVNYNVDISTSSSIEELTELLRSDKTFDIVFLSNTISGIENYDITTSEERKRTMTKLSLIAGYKLQIIMVTLADYKDSDTEYIKMPISKVKLDDIMVKYLSEK